MERGIECMTITKTYLKKLICAICKNRITDDPFGHNAEPVKKGKCCGRCNNMTVIPTRLNNLLK